MNMEAVLGVIRHVLTFAGGAFVPAGVMSGSELETGIGAIVTLVGLVWSVVAKKKAASAE